MALSLKTVRYAAWAGLNVIVAKQFNSIVTEPYMVRSTCFWQRHASDRRASQDEPFHVPQAQAYCKGDWFTWDPKITTPPGL